MTRKMSFSADENPASEVEPEGGYVASVVIQITGNLDAVQRQLVGIAESTSEEIRYEVLAIYSEPSDQVDAFLESIEGAFKTIERDAHGTDDDALSAAVADAVSDRLVFMAPGVIPTPGWIQGLLGASEREAGDAVIVGTRSIDSTGSIVQGGICFDSTGRPVALGNNHLSRWWHLGEDQSRLQAVAGDCVMISCGALERAPVSAAALGHSAAFAGYCLQAGSVGVVVIQADDATVLVRAPSAESATFGAAGWVAPARVLVAHDLGEKEAQAMRNLVGSGALDRSAGYERGPLERFLLTYYSGEIMEAAAVYRLQDLGSPPIRRRSQVEPVATELSPVIVIDPHWSDDSTAEPMLTKLGVMMPETRPSQKEMTPGSLAATIWSELNQLTLELMGLDWHRPFDELPACFEARFTALAAVLAEADYARAEEAHAPLWGLGDLRSLILIEWYVRAFPKGRFLVIRHSVESSAKLFVESHPELGDSLSTRLAQWHRDRAETFIQRATADCVVLDSALLLDDPVAASEALSDWLRIGDDPAKPGSAMPTAPAR